jgi:5,10-methylenetetrahydromethanopterin reductase
LNSIAPRLGYSVGSLLYTEDVLKLSKILDLKKNVHSVWVPESWGRESFSSLGAISQITKNVKLGTSIINIYGRTPATVAMGATTLDSLSNNRTILGLGSSTESLVENWHGLKFEKPLGRMREFIECLRQMTTGESVNHQGRFFNIKNFKLLNKPTRIKMPIYIAAINRHMVNLACELADGILLYLRPLDELRKSISLIKSQTENKNKNYEIACVFICALSNNKPEEARRRAAKTLAFYISVGKYYRDFLSRNGFSNEVTRITLEYTTHGLDSATRFVDDSMLDSLTICGNAEQCIRSLNRFISAGITLPILQVNPVGNPESNIKELTATF